MGEKLKNDVVVVTGAGRNIGRSIAELFAEEGAKVAVTDIHEQNAKEVSDGINAAGGTAISIRTDVSDEEEIENMVNEVEETFGRIDILVNNAAVKERCEFFEMDRSLFEDVLSVNTTGLFLVTQAVSKSMKENGGGKIVNIASTSGHNAEPDSVAYGTSKGAVFNFTRSVAMALVDYDIRVNTLTPGRTGQPTMPFNLDSLDEDEEFKKQIEEEDKKIAQKTPLGRLGDPIDQAKAALFLVSDDSSFVTGTELRVTGGRDCI